ncbi:MAG TPA: glycosyl hydrolase family 18 protein [Streptosporangiaceae bacterium]|nr:glycosyl hydrolase family 18 protein [Streptosporangiaceae bacterium]
MREPLLPTTSALANALSTKGTLAKAARTKAMLTKATRIKGTRIKGTRAKGTVAKAALTAVATAMVAATVLIATAPSVLAQSNLLVNGDFATGSTAGWTCSSADTVVSSPVPSGSRFALAGTPAGSDFAQCSQVVSVQPSSSYTLTGMVQGDYVFLGDSGTGTSDTSNWTPSAPSFTQLSTTFATGSATTSVTIYVHGWYGQPEFFAGQLTLTGPAGSGGGGGGTPPAAPTGLTVTGTTSSSVSLSWTAPSGPVTGYLVFKNGAQAASVTGTSATIPGLAASTTYSFTVAASNSAGQSPQSGAVSGTTAASGGGGGGGGLPAHLLMGYWQDFTNGAQPLSLASVPASYNLIAVAFGNADATPGEVTFSLDSGLSSALGGYTQQQFINDIHTLQSRGQKVILSVGGQNGTISVDDATSAGNFASSVFSIIKQYGFNGVDIDLENGVNPQFMASALEQLESDVGSGLIITLAPQTVDTQSTGNDYFQLALNIKSILTMINTQYYNSGSMNGCDGNVYSEATENFMTALACTELQGGLSPSQVGLGLPASPSAAGSGYVSPSVVNNALDCLAAKNNCGSFIPPATYPGIRGVMTWSINWDASNGYNFASTVAPHLASLP